MNTWTWNSYTVGLKERIIKPANRQVSVAGYPMSFALGTVVKKAFTISMSGISKSDKDNIKSFFDANQGEAFIISDQDPNGAGIYNVIFDQDELEFTYERKFPGEYSLELQVREV